MSTWTQFCTDNNISLIEDCAQAHLAQWQGTVAGAFGEIGAYSFYPTKNLGAIGDAGMAVEDVSSVTNFPEMMDGRVKTLHPRVHGGLLGRRDVAEHVKAMEEHGIAPIDLVCVNLYPFEMTVRREGVQEHEAIEQIDIGGPSMLRSAAKNHEFVTVVTDPAQYDAVASELAKNDGATTLELRRALAAATFARTAAYDTAISAWMAARLSAGRPGA